MILELIYIIQFWICKKSLILYSPKPDCDIKVAVNEVNIDNTNKKERYVHFNIDTEIKNKDEILSFKIADENKVLIKISIFTLMIVYSK